MTPAHNERLQKLKARTLVALARGFGNSPKNAAAAVTFLAGLEDAKLEDALDAGERAESAELSAALDPSAETGLGSPEPELPATSDTPAPPAAPTKPLKAPEAIGRVMVLAPAKFRETVWYNDKPYEIRANVVAELPLDVARHVAEYLRNNGIPFDYMG